MNNEFLPYEESFNLKEIGFDEPCFGKFYTKQKSKMFGVDEKGRHYPIKNTSKKLYTLGEYFVLNENNVIIAPLYQQAFRWFREKHKLVHEIYMYKSKHGVSYGWDIFSTVLPTDDELGDENDVTDYRQKRLESCESLAHSSIYSETTEHAEYPLAELECIKKMIEIVKERQDDKSK